MKRSTIGTTLAPLALALAAHLGAPAARAQASVGGTVYDSSAMRPLAGAVVQLVTRADPAGGRSFATMSDSTGAFRIEGVPAGDYAATFYHARLDELSIAAAVVPVHVDSAGDDVLLAVPGERTIGAMHCGARAGDSAAVVVGHLTTADARMIPVSDATIHAQWFELRFGDRISRSTPTITARTDPRGWFVLCGLPAEASIDLWATLERASTGIIRVDLAPAAVIAEQLSIDVGGPRAEGESARDGELRGVVRDVRGRPLRGARVGLRGSDATTLADDGGRYMLRGLPVGTQSVEARAIGFVPVDSAVTIASGRVTTLDLDFDSTTVVLRAVEVTGQVVYDRALREFEAARSRGVGHFIDRRTIEMRDPVDPSDLLRSVGGVHVDASGGADRVITVSGPHGRCTPLLVVDGARWPHWTNEIDRVVRPEEIAGMAVYTGIETPMLYRATGGDCGAIVIWTRRGGKVKR